MVCAPVRRDNPRALARGLSTYRRKTMLYLTCTMISSVDLARYGVSHAKHLGICGLWYKYVYASFALPYVLKSN